MARARAEHEASDELGPDDNVKGASTWSQIKGTAGVGEPTPTMAASQDNRPLTITTVGDPLLPLEDPRYWAAKWLAPSRRDWRQRGGAVVRLVLTGLVGGGCGTALALYLMQTQGWRLGLSDPASRHEPPAAVASRPSPMPPTREVHAQAPADTLATAATDASAAPGPSPSGAVVEPSAPPKSAAEAQPATPSLAPDEIAMLTRRAETYIADGDIVSARLLLEHAATARDARAALVLAATYDPDGLRRLGLPVKAGLTLDIAMAKTWYEKAVKYGSADASRLLAGLTGAARR